MATYYIDPSQPTQGDGSIGSPYTTLVGVTPIDGDSFLFKRGTVYNGNIETTNIAANLLTFDAYGTGDSPILTGLIAATFTQNGTYSFLFNTTLGANTGGIVCDADTPLNCVLWTTNLATTVATMSAGTYTYDYNTNTYYVWPVQSNQIGRYTITSILYGMFSTNGFSGLTIQNLTFKGYSRHGIQLLNRTNVNINNCNFYIIGGNSTSGTFVGNGIECSSGCIGGKIYNCTFKHIFDSPITTQLYTDSTSVEQFEIYNNIIYDAGLYGIEITIVGTVVNCTISSIYVHNNIIMNAGWNFRARNVTGRGITVGGNQATSTLKGILIKNNTLKDNRWGLSDQVGAVASVYFVGNTVVDTRETVRSRGIYTSGSAVYVGNLIKGYFYGIGSYGSTTSRVGKIYNCIIVNAEEAIQQDAAVGTLEIKNCVIWPRSRLVRIAVAGLTTTFQYNYWPSGLANGGLTVDGTNTQVSAFPLNSTYTLEATSALKYTGVNLGQKDYHNPPSIGAFEYIPTRGIR